MRTVYLSTLIASAVIIAFSTVAPTLKCLSKSAGTIIANNFAENVFVSDLIVWHASYSGNFYNLRAGYAYFEKPKKRFPSENGISGAVYTINIPNTSYKALGNV